MEPREADNNPHPNQEGPHQQLGHHELPHKHLGHKGVPHHEDPHQQLVNHGNPHQQLIHHEDPRQHLIHHGNHKQQLIHHEAHHQLAPQDKIHHSLVHNHFADVHHLVPLLENHPLQPTTSGPSMNNFHILSDGRILQMDASSQPEASVTHHVQVPGVQISHSQDVPLGHQHQAFHSQISKDDVSLSHQKQDPSVQISQHHDSAAPPVQQKSEGSGRRYLFLPRGWLRNGMPNLVLLFKCV